VVANEQLYTPEVHVDCRISCLESTDSITTLAGTLGAALATACAEAQVAANQQLGMRLLCNAFRSEPLREWLKQQAGGILDGFSPALIAPQKAVRGAAAAFLLNLAVLSSSERLGLELDAQALSAVCSMLSSLPKEDEDAVHRCHLQCTVTTPGMMIFSVEHFSGASMY